MKIKGFRDYCHDFWNIFDLSRTIFLIFYSLGKLVIFSQQSDGEIISLNDQSAQIKFADMVNNYSILAALNLLSWIRALSYLRLF